MYEYKTCEEYFGGDIFVVESLEDLKEISTGMPKSNTEHFSLFEQPTAFDVAEWSKDNRYVHISLFTNNNGGSLYIIPKEIADSTYNVRGSIEATKLFWG